MRESLSQEKVLKYLQTFFNNNLAILSWFIMCNLSVVLVNMGGYAHTPVEFIKEISKPVIHLLSGTFCAVVLVAALDSLSKYKIAKYIKYICAFLTGIIFAADLYTFIMFSSIVNQSVLEIVMTVNTHIIVDYFRNYFSFLLLPKVIAFGFCILLLHKLICLGIHYVAQNRLAITFLLFASMCSFFIMFIHRSSGAIRDFTLMRFTVNLKNAYDNVGNEEKALQAMMDALPDEITCYNNDENVILVLGESVDRNHMGMYGYGVDNTPYMTKRVMDKEIYVYDDVVSSANGTSASMSMMFTYAIKGDQEHWYNNANIFDIAKAVGYELTWLSNQNASGLTGSMDKVYSDICDNKQFTILGDSNESIPHDEELLSIIDNNNLHGEKKLSIIHLQGSHEPYYQRYPKPFNKFKAEEYDWTTEKGRTAIAEYDNSILYTDYILNEIIKRFENENVVLIYTSDHGAEVYNDREFCGHSMEEQGNRHMIEVPMFIWTSKKYRETHQEMIKRMSVSTERPFMLDDFIYVLTDLLNINIPSKNAKHSVLSNEYIPSHERYYNGIIYKKSIK